MNLQDVVHGACDLDKQGPDGSAQTCEKWLNICLCHGLIWREAKTQIPMKSLVPEQLRELSQ